MFRITLPQPKRKNNLLVALQAEELGPCVRSKIRRQPGLQSCCILLLHPSPWLQLSSFPHRAGTPMERRGRRGESAPPVSARRISKSKSPSELSFAAFGLQQRGREGGVRMHLTLSIQLQSTDLVILKVISNLNNSMRLSSIPSLPCECTKPLLQPCLTIATRFLALMMEQEGTWRPAGHTRGLITRSSCPCSWGHLCVFTYYGHPAKHGTLPPRKCQPPKQPGNQTSSQASKLPTT